MPGSWWTGASCPERYKRQPGQQLPSRPALATWGRPMEAGLWQNVNRRSPARMGGTFNTARHYQLLILRRRQLSSRSH